MTHSAEVKLQALRVEDTILSMGQLAFDICQTLDDLLSPGKGHPEGYAGRELAKLSGRVFSPEYRYPMPATLSFAAKLGIGLGPELDWLRPPLSSAAKAQAALWLEEYGPALIRFSDYVVQRAPNRAKRPDRIASR